MSISSNPNVLVSCVLALDIMGLRPSSGSGELDGADQDFRLLVQIDDTIALVIDYQRDADILESAIRLSPPHTDQHLLSRALQLNFADMDYRAGIDPTNQNLEIRGQRNLIRLDSGDLAIALSDLIDFTVSLKVDAVAGEAEMPLDFSNGVMRV